MQHFQLPVLGVAGWSGGTNLPCSPILQLALKSPKGSSVWVAPADTSPTYTDPKRSTGPSDTHSPPDRPALGKAAALCPELLLLYPSRETKLKRGLEFHPLSLSGTEEMIPDTLLDILRKNCVLCYTNLAEGSPFSHQKPKTQSHAEQDLVKAYGFNNSEVKPT